MSNNIRALRKATGLTMKQFGALMGVAESTISLYETGKNEPDISMLKKMSEFFGVSIDYLLNFSDLKEPRLDPSLTCRLKELRTSRGYTQEIVASFLDITRAAYTNLENGKRQCDIATLLRLADYYGVTLDYLLGRTDNPASSAPSAETKKQPAAQGGELDEQLVSMLMDLSPADVQRVLDFVAGMQAARKA